MLISPKYYFPSKLFFPTLRFYIYDRTGPASLPPSLLSLPFLSSPFLLPLPPPIPPHPSPPAPAPHTRFPSPPLIDYYWRIIIFKEIYDSRPLIPQYEENNKAPKTCRIFSSLCTGHTTMLFP